MSGRIHSLKRRDPEDLVLDLQNVSLSPPKKLRVSEQGGPFVTGSGSRFSTPQPTGETPFSLLKGPSAPALSALTPSTPLCSDTVLPLPPSPPVSVPASESKALVLYRPVNPPLFPGGPPCGSVDLPISLRLNSSMLPRPQGTDTGCYSPCFETTTSYFASQSPFSVDKDTPSGHGLFQGRSFQAWEAHRLTHWGFGEQRILMIHHGYQFGRWDFSGPVGGSSLPFGQKRLTRISSWPRLSSEVDCLPMIEEIDDKASQQLQVIPWVPSSTASYFSDTKPIIEEIEDGPFITPDSEEMVDADSMEVVTDDIIIPEVDTTTIGGQFGSPLPSFSAPSWPQYETLQPQFPTVMWSH